MVRKVLFILLVLFCMILSTSCRPNQTSPTSEPNLPNPASVYCEQNGGKLEFRTDATGGVSGVCHFPDKSECDEWAYFRKECKPGDSPVISKPTPSPVVNRPDPTASAEISSDGWKIYRNEELGYSFHYPADAQIVLNDEPLKSISIVGPEKDGERWPAIDISHPRDREEYRPPQGVDLLQWLTDHNLLGDQRMQDVQIAGTTAIHLRHARSPQSYAYDRYYFARDGQLYMIVIGHTADKEDWALYNHFLESMQFES
jgi:putative hemolysin